MFSPHCSRPCYSEQQFIFTNFEKIKFEEKLEGNGKSSIILSFNSDYSNMSTEKPDSATLLARSILKELKIPNTDLYTRKYLFEMENGGMDHE
jgi:hypothetical protein